MSHAMALLCRTTDVCVTWCALLLLLPTHPLGRLDSPRLIRRCDVDFTHPSHSSFASSSSALLS